MNNPDETFDLVDFIEGRITAPASRRLVHQGIVKALDVNRDPNLDKRLQIQKVLLAASKLVNEASLRELENIYQTKLEIPKAWVKKFCLNDFIRGMPKY